MISFHGAYTALVTPFTADGAAVDFDRLATQIARQGAGGVTGVVPCGTTGESPTLTHDEHREVVAHTVTAARRHGLQVIAGAGSNCTREAIEMHRFAASAGADATLHVCPYYNKPSQEGLFRHFSAIADSADLPVVLYNIPGRTGVCLSLETIERLAGHENIRAIKDATGGLQLAQQVHASTDLAILSGDDPLTLAFMSVGAVGVISVLSNLVPDPVASLCRAMLEDDLAGARTINAHLRPLAEALLGLDSNPVPIKAAMHMMDLDGGAVRLPLAPLTESATAQLRSLLRTQQVATV